MDNNKPMSLTEAFANPRAGRDNSDCKLMRIRPQLDEQDQETLDRVLEAIRSDLGNGKSKTYSVSWLHRVLKNLGFSISTSSIQRHINGSCGCGTVN